MGRHRLDELRRPRLTLGRKRVASVRIALADAAVPAVDEEFGALVLRNLTAPVYGFAPENAERVFQPQFSLKENGRGMGLTMVRRLLREQGASICVLNDRRRKGAAIEINLRAKRARAT
jgi:nitrogen fixation/metabolism regulation signal transduction histidine kinase